MGSALLGGTVSDMTGGKFANGAATAAFAAVVQEGVDSYCSKNLGSDSGSFNPIGEPAALEEYLAAANVEKQRILNEGIVTLKPDSIWDMIGDTKQTALQNIDISKKFAMSSVNIRSGKKTYEFFNTSAQLNDAYDLASTDARYSVAKVGGRFDPTSRTITIYRSSGTASISSGFGRLNINETLRWNMLHEVGHYMDFRSNPSQYSNRTTGIIESTADQFASKHFGK